MKKKILSLLLLLLFVTGCNGVQKEEMEDIVYHALKETKELTNTYRAGYKYYLPRGLKFVKRDGSNEILAMKDMIYYMYVDRVSYFHKYKEEYQEKTDVIYSKRLAFDDKFGYLEIKKTANDKYFIEIMYNYAKIEVIVEQKYIKESICYGAGILSSIIYQDEVLKNLMGENVLNSNEMEHNIFESAETESGYLKIVEEYGTYEEKNEPVDPDFIRR